MGKIDKYHVIHSGVIMCFLFYEDWLFDPKDNKYGWEKGIAHFEELVELTKEAVLFIHDNKLSKDDFEIFQKEFLDKPFYLKLSILGNRIEFLNLKDKTRRELEENFEGSDEFYMAQDVKNIIEYTEELLSDLEK